MASESVARTAAVTDDETTAPFAIGVAPPKKATRRIIKARRPPSRELRQSILNAPPAIVDDDASVQIAYRRAALAITSAIGDESDGDEIIIHTLSTINDDNENNNAAIERYVPNVVNDDESISSMSLLTLRGLENEPNIVSDNEGEVQNQSAKSKKVKKKTKSNKKPSKKNPGKKKGAKSPEQNENGVICSICVEADQPNDKWHRLVILPCCGSHIAADDSPKEYQFSTRFCAGCILKLVQTNVEKDGDEYAPWDDEREAFPVDVFYDPSPMLQGTNGDSEIIECPRCRHLVSVTFSWKHKFNYEEEECDCDDCQMEQRRRQLRNGVKSIDISKPSFLTKIKFVGRKRGMASLLWKMAYMPRNMISVEGLGGKEESRKIQQLVGWGVLKRMDDLFYLEKEDQAILLRLFNVDAEGSSGEGDEKRDWNMSVKLVPCMMSALWVHVKKLHLFRALKMLNHIGMIIHHFVRNLPPLPLNVGQEMVVTGLNIFCAGIILRLSLALVVSGISLFGSVHLACSVLRFSARQTDKMKQGLVLTFPLLVVMCYFGYRYNVQLWIQSAINDATTRLQMATTADMKCYFSSVLNILDNVSRVLGWSK